MRSRAPQPDEGSQIVSWTLELAAHPIACQVDLNVEQMREDLAQLDRAIEQHHPGRNRYSKESELDAAMASAIEAVGQPMDALSFFRIVAPVIARIRTSPVTPGTPWSNATVRIP